MRLLQDIPTSQALPHRKSQEVFNNDHVFERRVVKVEGKVYSKNYVSGSARNSKVYDGVDGPLLLAHVPYSFAVSLKIPFVGSTQPP